MLRLAEPHAGILVDRFVANERTADLQNRAARLPQLTLDERESADLELIATGAASPLTGFLGVRDYQSVLSRMRLANGTPWPIPFTLAVTVKQMAAVLQHRAAALRDVHRRLRGIITVTDTFVRSVADEANALYGTDDPRHPGVAYLLSRPPGIIGGPVTVLPVPPRAALGATAPREVRAIARSRRWSALAGIATLDGKGCLEAVGTVEPALLAAPTIALRHAPGRDALLQAIVLKNHGAREVYFEYDRSDWVAVSERFQRDELGVTPVWLAGTNRGRRPSPVSASAAR